MAIKWNNKILLAKIEATYGVDAVPIAENGVLATNVSFSPMEGQDVDRELELPYLAAGGTIPADLHGKMSFNVELAPSGTTGVAPAWGPLLRACACAQTIVVATSVTYNPVTDDHESVSIHFFIGSTRFVLLGTRGTVTMEFSASGIPYLRFELTGLFRKPTEVTRPGTDLTAFRKPQLVNMANTPVFTIGGTALIMRRCMLNLANQVEPRFLVGDESILITDRSDVLEATVVAVPLSTLDPYAIALADATVAVELVHGTGAGKIATLGVPRAQMQRAQGLENARASPNGRCAWCRWPTRATTSGP